MIVKRADGHHVYSRDGRHLAGPFSTRDAAERHVKKVDQFKQRDRKANGAAAKRRP